jgi:EmrB/QacA subfamily drug resistance transporter
VTDIDRTTPSSGDAVAAPERELHLGWALVLISIAQLMVVLDATIANIALPFIQIDLDISQANLTWIVTGYALAFGSLLLLGGRLGDLYGRRKVFMIGLAVFAVASLLGGLATNEPLLLAARGLQGLGAALASPAALALITTTFPAGPARNRAFAVYAAMSGAGAAVGLILGGWLTGSSPEIFGTVIDGWRLTFLINVPIGLVAASLAPRFLNESESHPGQLDLPGAVTGTLGLLGVVYGLSRAGTEGWTDTWTLASLAAGIAVLVAFGLIESRVEHPLLPFRIFTNRTRASSFVAMFLAPAAMFAMFFFLSQYIQNVMGYSPLKAGVAFLPFTAGIVVGAGLASNLVNRVNPRFISGVGTLLAAGALFGFSTLPYDTSFPASEVTGAYVTDLLPYITLMAVGMGLTFVPVTLTAVHHLRTEESGIGSGVLNTAQQIGGALGLAVLSTVATQTFTDRGAELAKAGADAAASGQAPSAAALQKMEEIAQLQVFTEGSTQAFLVGSFLMLAASAVIWIFLDVKHEELATDGPEGVHAG